jgi:hypothetical protein
MRYIFVILIILSLFSCEKIDSDFGQPHYITTVDTFLNDWTYRVLPSPNLSYSKAEFRMWLPENTTNLKGILALTPGYNCSGIELADDESWQNFATQENIALVGVTFEDNRNMDGYYQSFPEETGSRLINAVQKICERNDIIEVADLPFLLCGHSAGGTCSYNFSTYKPERTIGYINIKGGYATYLNPIDIPGLLVSGEFDYPELLYDKAMDIRKNNGLVCYAVEPDAYHEWGDPKEIMMPFLSAVLEKRIDTNGNLVSLSEESGFLGNLESFDYYQYNNFPDDLLIASWLISEEFAEKWIDFVSKK